MILLYLKSQAIKFLICTCYYRSSNVLYDFFVVLQGTLKNLQAEIKNIPIYLFGDSNNRIGVLNSIDENIYLHNCCYVRESKRGTTFCQGIEHLGYVIINGRFHPDIPGGLIYIDSKTSSIIDLRCCRVTDLHILSKNLKL